MLDSLYYTLYYDGTMKDKTAEVADILAHAEKALQQVIVEAAEGGDYKSVDLARATAVNVRELHVRMAKHTKSSDASRDEPRVINARPAPKQTQPKRRTKRADYPKFEMRSDMLHKIGWSKTQKAEYRHKVPRSLFERTVEALGFLSKSKAGPFTAEEIIEQVNKEQSEEAPSYQVYVAIGFLRQRECIRQVGREGYEVLSDFSDKVVKECGM